MAAQNRSPESPMALLTFSELIAKVAPDFNRKAKWKAVRHLDNRPGAPDLLELFRSDRSTFEFYQSIQSVDLFGDWEGIFSFLGLPNQKAMFIGAYRVVGSSRVRLESVPDVPPQLSDVWKAWEREQKPDHLHVRYIFEPDARFRPLELRTVIDWGKGALTWHQKNFDKPVVELREPYEFPPCPSYSQIDISLADLRQIYNHEAANSTWRDKLSAVGGIYLLTDYKNRKLYVGQANGQTNGQRGFWGRWKDYAAGRFDTGIKAAIDANEFTPDSVRVSVLEVIGIGHGSRDLMNKQESAWKVRLCARDADNGYNRN